MVEGLVVEGRAEVGGITGLVQERKHTTRAVSMGSTLQLPWGFLGTALVAPRTVGTPATPVRGGVRSAAPSREGEALPGEAYPDHLV